MIGKMCLRGRVRIGLIEKKTQTFSARAFHSITQCHQAFDKRFIHRSHSVIDRKNG